MAKVGIIGAMDEEIELYKESIKQLEKHIKAKTTFYTGILNGQEIVLCKSGVGKVNAAVSTQILIDEFQIDKVIFTGVAGALHPALEIGDIVISTAAQQHDIDASALGFQKGTIPFADQSIFKADKELIALALNACNSIVQGKAVSGMILSGDQFIAGGQAAKNLYETFNGYCTEMEGSAVAQVCYLNQIPFVIVRSMSDKADGSAHINFATFMKDAANNSYSIVNKMLGMLK